MCKRRDRELKSSREVLRWLQRISHVNTRPLVTSESVASFVELETDLYVGYGVGRHQQLVAVQARQEVCRNILIPKHLDFAAIVTLRLPFGEEFVVHEVDALHEKCARAGCRIKDL